MKTHLLPTIAKIVLIAILWSGTHVSAQTTRSLPIRVEKGKVYSNELFALGRSIVVEGEVADDVGAIFGDVRVRGLVRGNVSVLNGSVIIEGDGRVTGDIVCVGGSIDTSKPLSSDSKVIHLFGPEESHPSDAGDVGSRTSMVLFCLKTLLLFLSVILLAYAFPSQVREASFQLGQDPGHSALMGIVALALFALGLFLAFLLMVVAVGIPLFVLIGCTMLAFAIFGQVVVYFWMGQKIRHVVKRAWSLVFSIFAAILIIGLLSRIPYLGAVIQFLVMIFGIGVVLHTRFGTNKEWFTRRARVWSAD